MKKVLAIAVALTLVLSAVAFAGPNADAKVAVHVRDHATKNPCVVVINGCGDIVTTHSGASPPGVDAFPIFYELTEWKGVAYGLCWDPTIGSGSFTSCSPFVVTSFDIAGYMASGQGAAHTWTLCQMTPVAIPGFVWVYVYGPGMICPCDHPNPLIEGGIQVLDCAEGLDFPNCLVCAGVGGLTGDDPCLPTGAEATTWSEIKGLFE